MADDTNGTHWTLDKRVPLAFIMAIVLQTAGALWWASTMAATVQSQGQKIGALESQRAGERLAVVEATIGDVRSQLNRIESKLDRMVERSSKGE
jgi:hypothetical protein